MNGFSKLTPVDPLGASERELLSIIFRHRALSRSDITGRTSLAQQSVHRLLDGLHQRGFVRFGSPEIRGPGKPSPIVEIDDGTYATLGLSVTTEAVFLCLLKPTGTPATIQRMDAPANAPDLVMDELAKLLATSPFSERRLLGIGIAIQGYRTGDPERFTSPPLLAAWRGLPLVSILKERFGLPAFAENNATASATAEFFRGGGAGQTCLVYLSFNYGFGGGMFWEGRALVGAHGNAGELSGFFKGDMLQRRPALGELLKRLAARGVSLKSVSELCARFDPAWLGVKEWIEETAPQLCQIIAAIKVVLDPGAIFFGGDAPDLLRSMLVDAAQKAFEDDVTPNPVLKVSEIAGDAAHVGAGFLPLHALIL